MIEQTERLAFLELLNLEVTFGPARCNADAIEKDVKEKD